MRDCIPELGSAEMNVVDAEQVHVLDMPGECRAPHAKVEIRGVDPGKTFLRRRKQS